MKVIVSSTGNTMDSPVSPIFGRCPWFALVDSETMEGEFVENEATKAMGGAGVQSAQNAARAGAEAAISGNLGPNASQVLTSAGITVYTAGDMTVREAVEALKAEKLEALAGPNVSRDHGKPAGFTRGGRGQGMGGGMGRRS